MARVVSEQLTKLIMQGAYEEGCRVRNDYSGRGMMGDRCFGLEADQFPTAVIFYVMREIQDGIAMGDEETLQSYEEMTEDLERIFRDMRSDSMGLSMIYYFPNWKLDEETFEENDDNY